MTGVLGSSSTYWFAVRDANSTGHFRVSWIPDTKTIIFSLSWCAEGCQEYNVQYVCNTNVWIGICEFGSCTMQFPKVITSSVYLIAVPVFVVRTSASQACHKRHDNFPCLQFWLLWILTEIYSSTILTCMCVLVASLVIVGYHIMQISVLNIF